MADSYTTTWSALRRGKNVLKKRNSIETEDFNSTDQENTGRGRRFKRKINKEIPSPLRKQIKLPIPPSNLGRKNKSSVSKVLFNKEKNDLAISNKQDLKTQKNTAVTVDKISGKSITQVTNLIERLEVRNEEENISDVDQISETVQNSNFGSNVVTTNSIANVAGELQADLSQYDKPSTSNAHANYKPITPEGQITSKLGNLLFYFHSITF